MRMIYAFPEVINLGKKVVFTGKVREKRQFFLNEIIVDVYDVKLILTSLRHGILLNL